METWCRQAGQEYTTSLQRTESPLRGQTKLFQINLTIHLEASCDTKFSLLRIFYLLTKLRVQHKTPFPNPREGDIRLYRAVLGCTGLYWDVLFLAKDSQGLKGVQKLYGLFGLNHHININVWCQACIWTAFCMFLFFQGHPKVRRCQFLSPKNAVFRCCFGLSPIAGNTYSESLCSTGQNCSGKLHLHFYNIWDSVIFISGCYWQTMP